MVTSLTFQLLLDFLALDPGREVRALAHVGHQQLGASHLLLGAEATDVRLVGIAHVDHHSVIFRQLLVVVLGLQMDA